MGVFSTLDGHTRRSFPSIGTPRNRLRHGRVEESSRVGWLHNSGPAKNSMISGFDPCRPTRNDQAGSVNLGVLRAAHRPARKYLPHVGQLAFLWMGIH